MDSAVYFRSAFVVCDNKKSIAHIDVIKNTRFNKINRYLAMHAMNN